jgi:hypothetical protein
MPRDDDDDDDDRPRSRRRRDDDDDEDDRPRRRSRRDDEDDEDDWDNPRSGRKKKKSGSGPTVLIVVVVALLGCCGGAGVIGYFGFQRVQDAAGRTRDTTNMKQIAVGMHNHYDRQGTLPPAEEQLSWRVHILPYIEQENLHRQFDLTQPWDAPRNQAAGNVTVHTYTSSLDGASTQTRYRVFTGPGTLFEPGKSPKRLPDIIDGHGNTIFAVEAGETVPWPQPKELPFSPNGAVPTLGHPERDVVLMAMVDGSVRAVKKKNLDPTVLRGLVTPAGKEQVAVPE